MSWFERKMRSMGFVPAKEWLDENVPGWEQLTPEGLEQKMREFFREGKYKQLRTCTRDDAVKGRCVKIGRWYWAWVKVR